MAGVFQSIKTRLDKLEADAAANKTVRTQGRGVRYGDGLVDIYSPGLQSVTPSSGGGWNPDLWKPVIKKDIPIDGTNQTAGALLSVDNCMLMAGRMFKNFGSLYPIDNAVLSGCVFAVFDHPLWNGDNVTMRCELSAANDISACSTFSDNYSVMPLYYITQAGDISVDYRGMPSITMWS